MYNHDHEDDYYDTVLQFDAATLQWSQVGVMRQPRDYHGLSVVSVADIMDQCNQGNPKR